MHQARLHHLLFYIKLLKLDFAGGSDSKASAYNAGDPVSIPGSPALQADALPSEPPILGQKMYYSLVKGKNASSLLSITDTVLLKNSHPTEK